MKINWKALYSRLQDWKSFSCSWRQLGRQLSIPPSTFTRLKLGRSLSAEHLITICVATNIDAREYYVAPKKTRVRKD